MEKTEFDLLIDLATATFYAKTQAAYEKYSQAFSYFLDKYGPEGIIDPERIYEEARTKAKGSPRQFQNEFAHQINEAFSTAHPLVEIKRRRNQAGSSKEKQSELLVEEEEADVVIVGGGPIGYAKAIAYKKLNPELKVVVLEKYEEFKRRHTLVLQPKQFENYLRAAGLTKEPELVELLDQLRKSPHIRTNVLQAKLKEVADDYGVQTVQEEVKAETIEEQLFRYNPKLIEGADGTHSVVNQNLFPRNNQIKHEVDYAMQLRYEVDGDVENHWDHAIEFYQKLARQGLVATEQIGRRDPSTGKTPVTVQLILKKEDFDLLKDKATAGNPIRLENPGLPKHLKTFATSYIAERIQVYNKSGSKIVHESIAISVNELPALQVKETSTVYNGTDVSLSGDAALGLSYFKGLNAGLESIAKYFAIMRPAIEEGLKDKSLLREKLADYQAWYSPYADKKVSEVEQYSTFRVRSLMKLVKIYRGIKFNFSQQEHLFNHESVIESYYKLLAQPAQDQAVHFNFYPHRSYNPEIKLGQFDHVPLTYSLKKIAKLFTSYFRGYRETYQLKQDFKQPFVGIVNVSSGIVKLIAGTFTLNIYRFSDGFLSLIRGLLEIVTAPFAWTVKPIIRLAITAWLGFPKIEENSGLKQLVGLGEELLVDQTDDDFSFEKMWRILGLCNDLHRKLEKQVEREQETDINIDEENTLIREITSKSKPLKLEQVKHYFTLFGGKFSEQNLFTPEEEERFNRAYTG